MPADAGAPHQGRIGAEAAEAELQAFLERDRLELPDDLELTEHEIEDIRRLIRAFAASPLYARIANAGKVTRDKPWWVIW